MFRRLAVTLVTALVGIASFAAPVLAGPGEGELLALINAERAAAGLPALASHSSLASHARTHSAAMLADDTVRHSGYKSAASGWSRIGENVGRGPTVASLHYAFMSSPGHRKNILGDYSHAGVGTAVSDGGIVYATVVFMLAKGSATSTAPTTTTTTAPQPTTTTTPAPTTTTAPATTATPPPGPSTGNGSGSAGGATGVAVRSAAVPGAAAAEPGLSEDDIARRLPWAAVAGLKPCTS